MRTKNHNNVTRALVHARLPHPFLLLCSGRGETLVSSLFRCCVVFLDRHHIICSRCCCRDDVFFPLRCHCSFTHSCIIVFLFYVYLFTAAAVLIFLQPSFYILPLFQCCRRSQYAAVTLRESAAVVRCCRGKAKSSSLFSEVFHRLM